MYNFTITNPTDHEQRVNILAGEEMNHSDIKITVSNTDGEIDYAKVKHDIESSPISIKFIKVLSEKLRDEGAACLVVINGIDDINDIIMGMDPYQFMQNNVAKKLDPEQEFTISEGTRLQIKVPSNSILNLTLFF